MSRLQLNSEDLLLVDDLVLGWVWFFRYNYLSNFKSDFYAVKVMFDYLMSRLHLTTVLEHLVWLSLAFWFPCHT